MLIGSHGMLTFFFFFSHQIHLLQMRVIDYSFFMPFCCRDAVLVHNCVRCLRFLYIHENRWEMKWTAAQWLAYRPTVPNPLNMYPLSLQVTLWVLFWAIHSVTVRACRISAPPCNTLNDQLYSSPMWWGCCCFWYYFSRWQTPFSMVPFLSAAWLPLQSLYARLNEIKYTPALKATFFYCTVEFIVCWVFK